MLNRKLIFFVSVVENGSFTAAAKKFYLTQSAISQQILQLEEELGVQLFDRSGYRPVLTDAGKYYYEECKKLLRRYDVILEKTHEIDKSTEKVLRIGITGPIEKKLLPQLFNEYKKQYSDVCIDVKKVTFEKGVEYLINNSLDIAFGISNEFKGKSEISTVHLSSLQMCIVCSREHPWANRHSINCLELNNQPIISFSEAVGNQFYLDFIESFKKDGVTPNIVKKVIELEELLFAVKINQGIALISREVIMQEDDVCMLNIENTHHHADFSLNFLRKEQKDYTKAFITATTDYFSSLQ